MQSEAQEFHKWAKDAGNKLRAYVLSYASGATAVFFLALTGKDLQTFTPPQKALLIAALLLFVATAGNTAFKKLRLALTYGSYLTVILATMAVVGFLILRIA